MPGTLAFGLSEDVLIYIYSFLEPPDIICLAQTCKILHELASLRIIWTNACSLHVMPRGYPFPEIPPDDIPTQDLIYFATHAYALAKRWISGLPGPRKICYISGTSGTYVSDVRFVPGHDHKLILVVSNTVWSTFSIWQLGEDTSRKVCEWSPRGAIFTGFVLNKDIGSEASVAVSLQLNEEQSIKILRLKYDGNLDYSFQELYSANTDMKPITLLGDLLALSDDTSKMAIWNWREGTRALLEHPINDPSVLQSNDCIQVLFSHHSIIVARARSIHLFPHPELKHPDPKGELPPPYSPIASHSFGWVDGECMTICPFLRGASQTPEASWPALSVLVRGESDDPWAADIHNLELYTFAPNPAFSLSDSQEGVTGFSNVPPYIFPPQLTNKVACLRGSLRCKQVILGRFGTAVWIQPRDRFRGGLLADIPPHLLPSTNVEESLIMAAFPGSLNPRPEDQSVIVGKKMFGNEFNASWTSIDYDEVGGRVVLGSSFGRVTILQF